MGEGEMSEIKANHESTAGQVKTKCLKKAGPLLRLTLNSRLVRNAGLSTIRRAGTLPSVRRFGLKAFKQIQPTISETEEQALKSGGVGKILSGIYNGQIDWDSVIGSDDTPLSTEEKAFIEGPVEEFCKLVDEYSITTSDEKDMPQEAWDFAKANGFMGLEIPREYGGMGFSPAAHADIVRRISTRSFSAAVNVMVPNSLGPASVILHSGTKAQKDYWLPKLARGEVIPSFGLTEENAGSDATGIETTGIVKRGTEGQPYIHIENEGNTDKLMKRYISLAPCANEVEAVVGLAIKVKDPNNLLGKGEEPGISVALLDGNTPGLGAGRRHDPLGAGFKNGTLYAEPGGIAFSTDSIVGGEDGIGEGWPMLVSLLSVGRGISLPSVGVAGMARSLMVAADYAVAREQFGLSVGKMEINRKSLGEMAGETYAGKALRETTLRAINNGENPAVETTIAKYHLSESLFHVTSEATQILAGKDIQQGPNNPGLEKTLAGAQIARTVEGARNLNRGFIIPNQGTVRVHPHLVKEIEASQQDDKKKAANDLWDIVVNGHLSNLNENVKLAYDMGRFKNFPEVSDDEHLQCYYHQLNRLSAAFNVAANTVLTTMAGALKRKGALGEHLGDTMRYLYATASVLEKFEREARPESDKPLLDWSCQTYLARAENALWHFVRNYRAEITDIIQQMDEAIEHQTYKFNSKGKKLQAGLTAKGGELQHKLFAYTPDYLATTIFPEGRLLEEPLDRDTMHLGDLMQSNSQTRKNLVGDVYVPANDAEALSKFGDAFSKAVIAGPVVERIKNAAKKGEISGRNPQEALTRGVISQDEADTLENAQKAASKVVRVDDFPPEHFVSKRDAAPA